MFQKLPIPTQILRLGIVSSIDEKRCTAKVYFEDRDDTVSYDLKIVVPQTMKNKFYYLPNIGETVLCCFLQNGHETGFILGSVYSEVDKPPFEDEKIKGVQFEDGTVIKYDIKTSTLTIDCKNAINIIAPGNVNVTGDVIADGISLKHHVHPGTGEPVG
jgi:phage baseplate assembly protein V